MSIPKKIQYGQNWKSSTVNTINDIVDYLGTQKLVATSDDLIVNNNVNGQSISINANNSLPQVENTNMFQLSIVYDENDQAYVSVSPGIYQIFGSQQLRRLLMTGDFQDLKYIDYVDQEDKSEILNNYVNYYARNNRSLLKNYSNGFNQFFAVLACFRQNNQVSGKISQYTTFVGTGDYMNQEYSWALDRGCHFQHIGSVYVDNTTSLYKVVQQSQFGKLKTIDQSFLPFHLHLMFKDYGDQTSSLMPSAYFARSNYYLQVLSGLVWYNDKLIAVEPFFKNVEELSIPQSKIYLNIDTDNLSASIKFTDKVPPYIAPMDDWDFPGVNIILGSILQTGALNNKPSAFEIQQYYTNSVIIYQTGGAGEYNNYFKCQPIMSGGVITAVKVFDGGDPNSVTAGRTDIGNLSVQTVPVSGDYIFLSAGYSTVQGNIFYNLSIQSDNRIPDIRTPNILLAQLTNDKRKLIQRWVGGQIYFGSRFFI